MSVEGKDRRTERLKFGILGYISGVGMTVVIGRRYSRFLVQKYSLEYLH